MSKELIEQLTKESLRNDALRVLKQPWTKCACGSIACKREYPADFGMFYQGSGFDPADKSLLIKAFEALADANKEKKPLTTETFGELYFEGGQLVKVGMLRPQYMDGNQLLKLIGELGKLLYTKV